MNTNDGFEFFGMHSTCRDIKWQRKLIFSCYLAKSKLIKTDLEAENMNGVALYAAVSKTYVVHLEK